jgi:hypothetical protein
LLHRVVEVSMQHFDAGWSERGFDRVLRLAPQRQRSIEQPLPAVVTLMQRWRASVAPWASSTQPAATSGLMSRLRVVRSMPSSRASAVIVRDSREARRRIENWLMLIPAGASSRS